MHHERFDRTARRLAATDRRGMVRAAAGLLAGAIGIGAAETGAARCKRESEQAVRRAIRKAANRYNQSYKAMLCVAKCESALDNCAVNRQGRTYGLFQFLRSTWDDTPYGNKDIFEAKWNALGAAALWKDGRQNEWTCCDRRYGCKCR